MSKEDKKENSKNQEEKKEEGAISPRAKKNIAAIFLVIAAAIFGLSFFGKAGVAGIYIDKFLSFLLGVGKFFLPFLMVVMGGIYFKKIKTSRQTIALVGAMLMLLGILGAFHLPYHSNEMLVFAKQGKGGGLIGFLISYPLSKYLGKIAATIILTGILMVSLVLLVNVSFYETFEKLFFFLKGRLLAVLRRVKLENEKRKESQKEAKNEEAKLEKAQQEDSTEKEESSLFGEDLPEEGENQEGSIANNIKKITYEDGLMANGFNGLKKKKMALRQFQGKDMKRRKIQKRMAIAPANLIKKGEESVKPNGVEEKGRVIENAFRNYGIEMELVDHKVGPMAIQYSFRPSRAIRMNSVKALQDELAFSLAAHPIRIEAPIPGKSLVGIEVPLTSKFRGYVFLRQVLENPQFIKKSKESKLSIAIGKDMNGDLVIDDIGKMPHLLVAGASGTGKSVCLNAIISTLLFQNSPEDLNLLLVDPKKVEFSLFEGIPHLINPVIAEPAKVIKTLKWLVTEMEERLGFLSEVGSRDIDSYNQKVATGELRGREIIDRETGEKVFERFKKIPHIILIIDELGDLMIGPNKREIETRIVQLAQKARAAGVHLILATQRPSVDVVTGLIKANIGTRIAFRTTSATDSRTILDRGGAENLLGNGDLLFLSAEFSIPRRMQGVFISEKEIKRIVGYVTRESEETGISVSQALIKSYKEKVERKGKQSLIDGGKGGSHGSFGDEEDSSEFIGEEEEELYNRIKEMVIMEKKVSTSYIQRRFKIGYGRAARMIDQLEREGIVSPPEGNGRRKVLIETGKDNQLQDQENDSIEIEKTEGESSQKKGRSEE